MEICWMIMCFCAAALAMPVLQARTDRFEDRKEHHRSKSFSSKRMKRVATMSESENQMNIFRELYLNPLLRVRVPDTPAHTEVQHHITHHLRSFGWHVDEDTFEDSTPYGKKRFTNIIGTQDTDMRRKLTIACHYDSKYFTGIEFIGATDSAVPCAMMLDLARHLNSSLWEASANKYADGRDVSLQFMFFDGEEAFKDWSDTDSLYGARHLASKMLNQEVEVGRNERVSAIKTMDMLILLDLIGAKNPSFKSFFSSTHKYFERLQKIEKTHIKEGSLQGIAATSKQNVYFKGQLQKYGHIQDDHIPFLQKDVPVLHLISSPFPSVWHKATDNENALDYRVINNLNIILRTFVAEYLALQV